MLRPLSPHGRAALGELAVRPCPVQEYNPGLVRRLMQGGEAEIVRLPSPFSSHKGRAIEHLQITPAGRAALQKGEPE